MLNFVDGEDRLSTQGFAQLAQAQLGDDSPKNEMINLPTGPWTLPEFIKLMVKHPWSELLPQEMRDEIETLAGPASSNHPKSETSAQQPKALSGQGPTQRKVSSPRREKTVSPRGAASSEPSRQSTSPDRTTYGVGRGSSVGSSEERSTPSGENRCAWCIEATKRRHRRPRVLSEVAITGSIVPVTNH